MQLPRFINLFTAVRRMLLVSVALVCFHGSHWQRAASAGDIVVEAIQVINGPGQAVQAQFRAQYEPLLKVELSFVNRACKLSDDERGVLITKSNAWFDKFVRDLAKSGGQPQGGVWMGFGRAQQSNDPRAEIEKNVAKIVDAELPKEKAAIYAEECQKRQQFIQETAVDSLVARIDKELILTLEQREKIAGSLNEHWEKTWAPQLEMFMHGMDFWPNVPDKWIRPHLTETQQTAWSKVHRNTNQVFFNAFGNDGPVVDDIDLTQGKEKDVEQAADKAAPVPYNAVIEVVE